MSTHQVEISRDEAEAVIELAEAGACRRPDILIYLLSRLREAFGMAPMSEAQEYDIIDRCFPAKDQGEST